MKRGIMTLAVSLEELDAGIEVETAPVSDDAVDAAVASTSAEIDSTEADAGEIEEAEQISDVLDTYETQLGGEPAEEEPVVAEGEKAEGGGEAGPAEETGDAAPVGVEGAAPAEGEGRTEAAPEGEGERAEFVPPSEETLKAIEVAVEHFRVRLGYPKRVFPAMEAFADCPDAVRERALKNVQLLNAALKKQIVVAEEGFIDRAINAIGRAFQTYISLAKHIDASAVKIGAHGVNGKVFDDAAWARVFAASGKTEVSAGDIAGCLHKYNAEFHTKAMPILMQASRQISEVALAMSKSNFIAKDEEVEKIHGFNENLKALAGALGQFEGRDAKADASVKVGALSQEDAMALAKMARESALDKPVMNARKRIGEDLKKINQQIMRAYATRAAGVLSADSRAAFKVLSDGAKEITKLMNGMAKVEFHILHGVAKYLAASAA